jgi:hypothetical protein
MEMTPEEIKEIRADIAAFADNEENVLLDKGTVVFERDRTIFECRLSEPTAGHIDIEYNDTKMPYFKFLAEELGRLPVLAHAIQQKRPDVNPYVDTKATLVDGLGKVIHEHASGLETLRGICAEQIPGETRLVFLTGDAGEGKTALLRRLARKCASEYTQNKSSWFLLHIDTQGRSFVRLEEAVAGELGQLRISGLFYSGVIRLIRRGLLAIAIDGFDELLAEVGSGEAYSGLGGFLRQLNGSGVVVAAARSAYFEGENYTAQSKLLSSLSEVQVTIDQMRLEKWNKEETVSFFESFVDSDGYSITNPSGLYDELEELLGPTHVILHRPFLVQQVAKMLAPPSASPRDLIGDIGQDLQRVVPNVIRAFLKREVEEKWRDPSGQPYLTLEQHVHLLAAVAEEMWIQAKNGLPVEMVQLVAETVVDYYGISPSKRVQVLERVKAHAFLPTGGARRTNERAFDHEEFWHYFLAANLAQLLKTKERASLYRFLDRRSLPAIAAKWATVIGGWTPDEARGLVAMLNEMCISELRSGYMKQNSGLIAGELARLAVTDMTFDSMYFEGEVLRASHLSRAEFTRCVFNDLVLVDCEWTDCTFSECDVAGTTVRNTRLENCIFDERCTVVGVLQGGDLDQGFRTYVRESCERILASCGAQFPKSSLFPTREPIPPVPDDRRHALEKFLRIFERNTGAVESVIQLKLGQRLRVFEREVLPILRKHEVIRETTYRGRGGQSRYELCFPLETILQAEDPESPGPAQLVAFWQEMRG